MAEEKVSDKGKDSFACPMEVLFRGLKEMDRRYVHAFSSIGDFSDPSSFSLLRTLITDCSDTSIRSCALSTLVEAFPGEAYYMIEYVVENSDDELGDMVDFYLADYIPGRKPVRISDRVLENLASSQDPVLRKRAIRILSGIKGASSSELLIGLLEDPESSTRREAAYCLGDRRYQKATGSLRKLLDDSYEDIRRTAIVALAKLGDKLVIPNARVLLDKDLCSFLSGIEALYLLGALSPQEVLDRVIEKVTELDALMYCQEAGWMVCRIADESFLEPLIELMEKDECYGRELAFDCIWAFSDRRIDDLVLREAEDRPVSDDIMDYIVGLHDPKALDLILEEFDSGILPNHKSLYRLRSLIQRVNSAEDASDDRIRNRLKDDDTLDRILTILLGFYARLMLIEVRYPEYENSKRHHMNEKIDILTIISLLGPKIAWRIIDAMLEDPCDAVRMEAALALAGFDPEQALEVLLNVLISVDNLVMRWEAAGHIAGLWGDRKIDELIEILKKEDEEIVWPVIEILGYLRNPDAVQSLKPMLKHCDWWIRASAVRALGMIGDPSVRDDLTELLSDESEHVRFRVEEVPSSLDG